MRIGPCMSYRFGPDESQVPGQYRIVFNWSRLDWNFPSAEMRRLFESRQYWKNTIPAGVKVDRQGRYYVTVPRWEAGVPSTLNRIVIRDGKPVLDAFPSWAWNDAGSIYALRSVLGFEIDEYNRMWILDQGKIGYSPSPPGSQKLIVWDLDADRLIDAIPIPDDIASYRTSFLDDLVVDNRNGFVYITDAGSGAQDAPVAGGLIVYDMRTRKLRRVLDRHYSTQDLPGFQFQIDTKPVYKTNPLKIGADGIALSADRSTLYYSPLTGRNLYAVDTALLQDFRTPPDAIGRAVRAIGSKRTVSGGIYADNRGNVYYTMMEGKGIGYYSPSSHTFHDYVSDDRMLWVDGVAFDQQGSLLFNSNKLHLIMGGYEIDWSDPFNFIIWKAFVGHGVKSYLYA